MLKINSTIVIDVDVYLGHYDNDHAMQVLPAIVWLGLLMVVGVIGNSLVCYVYIWKFRRSTARCFIVALAVYDLINSLISIAIEIADMRHRYTFGAYTLCKVGIFCITFSSIASGTVLIAVAVDRYKKICTPLQSQLTVELSKVVITVCSVSAFIVALPAVFIYGGMTVMTDNINMNINGSDCSVTDEYAGTIYPLIYTVVQFLIFLSATITLSVLYSLIWRQASGHQRFRNNIKTVDTSDDVVLTSSTDANVAHPKGIPLEPVTPTRDRRNLRNQQNDEEETNFNQTEESKEKSIFNFLKEKSSASRQTRRHRDSADAKVRVHGKFVSKTERNKKGLRKTTFMLFLITLVFVLSYLPHLGLQIAKAVNKDVDVGLRWAELAAYNLFMRSYFINSASNPIIYSFCNELFRRELKQLAKTITCRV